jgi:hypothetical protein
VTVAGRITPAVVVREDADDVWADDFGGRSVAAVLPEST